MKPLTEKQLYALYVVSRDRLHYAVQTVRDRSFYVYYVPNSMVLTSQVRALQKKQYIRFKKRGDARYMDEKIDHRFMLTQEGEKALIVQWDELKDLVS